MVTRAEERRNLRRSEWFSFLFFTLILLPAIAVILVGAYGFTVWMSHEIYGPPTVSYEASDPAGSADAGKPTAAPTDGAN